jgi:hypothetical protein
LAPADADVISELSALYTALEDYRGMVQLYEDQILRSKDQTLRADLSREVALLWRDRLKDARETADAWRRVLRLRPGDAEATEGLTAAKQAMLKQRTETAAKAPAEEPVKEEPAQVAAKEEAAKQEAGVDQPAKAEAAPEEPVQDDLAKMDAAPVSNEASDEVSVDLGDSVTNPPPGTSDDDDAMSAAVTVPPKSADADEGSDVAVTIPPKGKGKGKKNKDIPLDD